MAPQDPNELFRQAERAFAAKDYQQTLALLKRIEARHGPSVPVRHLTALALRRTGDRHGARSAFEAALALAPDDPQIRNNYGNLLLELGRLETALIQFDTAIAARPLFDEARINRAIALHRLGRHADALHTLSHVAPALQTGARCQSIRGAILYDLGDLSGAATAFDVALAREPRRPAALIGRARVALERGEADAVDRYRAALAGQPDNDEIRLGLALALEAAGDESGLIVAQEVALRRPDWPEVHEQLARMQSEAGRSARIRDSYDTALGAHSDNEALHLSLWRTLVRAQRFDEVLNAMTEAPASIARSSAARLVKAMCLSEMGEEEEADRAFEAAERDRETLLAQGRHFLRTRRPEAAAALLEAVVQESPEDVTGWAHLALAWRVLEDPLSAWLCTQDNLWGVQELGLSDRELDELAHTLRGLHRSRAHPIGQSLRGGTQTRGRLLARDEPILRKLSEALFEGVRAHVARLPPTDRRHPLLRHRDQGLRLAGSWSVRLSGSGYHVSHIHPLGILSSAFYVAVPGTTAASPTREGWLEIGAPPVELGLDLEALATIEPRPGRLVLFPSYLFHGTRPFPAGERLTVAFDVMTS